MIEHNSKDNLNSIRQQIQRTHLILIILITVLLSFGGAWLNVNANDKEFNRNLQDTAELISSIYTFTSKMNQEELNVYMDSIAEKLSHVDLISIVNTQNIRLYHSNHSLIGQEYTGKVPDFETHKEGFYTENDVGPSGPQKRSYTPLYDDEGNYSGFIMTIMLQKSIRMVTERTVLLFVAVLISALALEIIISRTLSRRIKKQFLEFAEDLEGTKYLVDSMRANNHDFTNKLHVILGLVQIGQYDKAVSYIENISIIQRDTLSGVMNRIHNPSFAALLVGKIARASECNVKFILKEGSQYESEHINIPSEALVTICGNLIENALDAMNTPGKESDRRELIFGTFTKPGKLLITVEDFGCGIPPENREKIFENGFSSKGTGRGIGLYHTKQLIERLGGTIKFESAVGAGTTFVVSFKEAN